MAATATVIKKYGIGGTATLYFGTIALDSSYPTNGEAIDIASGNERIEHLVCDIPGYVGSWDAANQKLKVYWGNAGTASILPEVTNATDLSAITAAPFIAIGS